MQTMNLIAYEVSDATGWTLSPAPFQRRWMDETAGRGAYRCLPLNIANQAGWFLYGPASFTATWNGSVLPEESIRFEFNGKGTGLVMSHFGSGVVTFQLPFLFRTPPGVGLLVRGAPNWPKANFHALEGLVETDWNPAPFTMNWKIMEPERPVRFDASDPVCFLQPFDLGLPEKLSARRRRISEEPRTSQRYVMWRNGRAAFLESDAKKRGDWQKDYFQGSNPDGRKAPAHRTVYHLSEFRGDERSTPPPEEKKPE